MKLILVGLTVITVFIITTYINGEPMQPFIKDLIYYAHSKHIVELSENFYIEIINKMVKEIPIIEIIKDIKIQSKLTIQEINDILDFIYVNKGTIPPEILEKPELLKNEKLFNCYYDYFRNLRKFSNVL